jgi:hypothetical protein
MHARPRLFGGAAAGARVVIRVGGGGRVKLVLEEAEDVDLVLEARHSLE